MSQEFMDPEIFADFIVEAKEHLETIEPNLLELEQSPENLDLLNDIFRPMHSLKGASGFLGLNKMNVLAHRSENILDELRKGKIPVTSEIMDVILSSTDALRQMIENLEAEGGEGEVDTAAIIATLDSLLAGGSPPSKAKPKLTKKAPAAPTPAPAAPAAAPVAAAAAAESLPPFVPTTYGLQVVAKEHLDDFLEEAKEIAESLSSALVQMEKGPGKEELVNDIFRYFHNLKGNSGIVGYAELNALTHEAETLLNRVRKGEMAATQGLTDMLLTAVDAIVGLLEGVDRERYEVTPVDTRAVLARLQAAAMEPAPAAPAAAPQPPAPAAPDLAPEAPELDEEDLSVFESTVGQQIANIDLALAELSKNAEQREYVDGLYRSLVGVQNSAQYMGYTDIKLNAERTAGLVDQARKTDMSFELMVDILKQECSILKDMVNRQIAASAVAPAPAPAPAAPAPAPAPAPEPAEEPAEAPAAEEEGEAAPDAEAKAQRAAPAPAGAAAAKKGKPAAASSTIRVDHEKLDHLMNLIGELIINRNRFSMIAKSMEEGSSKADLARTATDLTETTYAMARISDDLQDTIMKVRMVPVSTVFTRFPRLVRDLSRKSGKKVELITQGEETELDKSVIEVIGDPLVHLIRNSMDHGLESNEERVAAGKPEIGRVWLRAYHRGNSVAIEVEDDGNGIDPKRMREVGVKKGVVTQEEANALDDRGAVELIFAPGFSSAEKITDISGRGVGMDVVRTNIKNLKGTVDVQTHLGKGTKFVLSLPLTLAIIDALMIMVDKQMYAIPLDAVSETTKIEADLLTEVNGRNAVTLRGEVLGILELAELLDLPLHEGERDILPVVVIQDNQRRLGLVVDRLLERQEIVIKPLGSYLGDCRGLSGATIMGDGSVVLILDPHEVYKMATTRA